MTSENELRRLVLWNRMFFVGFLLLGLAGMSVGLLHNLKNDIHGVETSWTRDRDGKDMLRITSMRGPKLITHLVEVSSDIYAGSSLPDPIFILDSEGASIDFATLQGLEWRNESGSKESPPAAGAVIRALYVELNASNWKPSQARQ